ncbi:MAG: aromatic ring-hydroxylating dioxygenase subunit alpha [Pseudomonadota bacterium]
MSSPVKFDHTLDQPLKPDMPARMLAAPQSVYTDPEVFANEIANIYEKDWVMVGRGGMIPNPGDYFTAMLGRKPIIVIRQKDGSIRAMANFCLHRYAKLLTGSGTAKRIVCPYHAWTYEMGGALIGVTDRDGFEKADTEGRALETLSCDEYMGFVFVSLRDDLQPLSKRLKGLNDTLTNFDVSNYEERYVEHEEVWHGNWKLIVENFIESYHVTYAHKGSIGPTNPTRHAEFGSQSDDGYFIHSNSYRPEDYPEIFNDSLTEEERRRFYVIPLYPNGLAAVDPNFIWWMALEPLGVDRTNARWGLCFSRDTMEKCPDPDGFVKEIIKVIEIATKEDQEMVSRVQEGCAFGSSEPGLLHAPLEWPLKAFSEYVRKTIEDGPMR